MQDTAGTPTVFWQANSQNAAGQVTGETLGNGLTASRTYDAFFRLTAVSATSGSTTPHSQTFSYDPIGNVIGRSDVTQSVTESFAYDDLNRLTSISGSGLTTRSFDYNAIGNLTGASGTLYPATGSVSFSRTLTYASFNLPTALSHTQGSATYNYTYRRARRARGLNELNERLVFGDERRDALAWGADRAGELAARKDFGGLLDQRTARLGEPGFHVPSGGQRAQARDRFRRHADRSRLNGRDASLEAEGGHRTIAVMMLTAILMHAPEGGFTTLNPETGTATQGESVEEALANLRETTGLYLEEFPHPDVGQPIITTFQIAEHA